MIDAPTSAEYLVTNSARLIEASEANGLCVSLPAENELQIDIDSDADWSRFLRGWEIFSREFPLVGPYLVTPSKSGTGKHVRIRTPWPVEPWQRIAWQASLGSDHVRELLSGVRLIAGDPHPTLLVETPQTMEAIHA